MSARTIHLSNMLTVEELQTQHDKVRETFLQIAPFNSMNGRGDVSNINKVVSGLTVNRLALLSHCELEAIIAAKGEAEWRGELVGWPFPKAMVWMKFKVIEHGYRDVEVINLSMKKSLRFKGITAAREYIRSYK